MYERILVTGASGQVGGAVVHALKSAGGVDVLAPTRAEMDLASEDSIRTYVRAARPTWIVSAGAYTAVDKAESEPEVASAINGVAPGVLGKEAAACGAKVIHFSTDYVFDGTLDRPYRETDATGPASVYGATKLAGEQALAASGAEYAIFRTSWVYAATGKNFLRTILRLAAERPELKIVADQHGAPTTAGELTRLTMHVLGRGFGPGGLFHATGAGETTWFGFAQEIVRLEAERRPGVALATISGISTAEYPTPARRPANSRLDCSRLAAELRFRFADWRAALAGVMAETP